MADTEATITAELSTVKPHHVRLYLPDGQTKDLPIPARAGRWNITAGIMSSLPWDRAELIDKAGAVVGVINTEPAAGNKKPDVEEPREVQLLRILKEAQGMIFTEMRDTFGRVFDVMAGVLETTTERLNTLELQQQAILDRERRRKPEITSVSDDGDGQRSVTDELMLTVGRGIVQKMVGADRGLAGIQEAVGKMNPEKLKSIIDQLSGTGEAGETAGDGPEDPSD